MQSIYNYVNGTQKSPLTIFNQSYPFQSISGVDIFDRTQWPSRPGVYVVWGRVESESKYKIIYIGMTGKFRNCGIINDRILQQVFARYTPYWFDTANHIFYYGATSKQMRNSNYIKHPSKSYYYHKSYAIHADNLVVHCFTYNGNRTLTPSCLEALLVQGYSDQNFNWLPLANNAF